MSFGPIVGWVKEMTGSYNDIKLDREEGIATLILDKPPLNVLDIAMMEEMNDALKGLVGASTLKALVIKAEGKAFSAGVDISDHTEDKVEDMIRIFHDIFRNMTRIHAPIVAAVKGAALGGGCEVAIFCDIVLASEKAKFGQPEIQVGVFPPIAAVTLPHLIGRGKALELVLTGDIIRADEAHRIGLVNQVYPIDEFDDKVEEYVAKLARLSAPVLQLTKRSVTESMGRPFDDALSVVERIYLDELMETEDAHEGLAAFLEKRGPVWKDR
jgi:cyclohexa-1,5-dienecarbonyl-CoA hydratase